MNDLTPGSEALRERAAAIEAAAVAAALPIIGMLMGEAHPEVPAAMFERRIALIKAALLADAAGDVARRLHEMRSEVQLHSPDPPCRPCEDRARRLLGLAIRGVR